MKRAYITLFFLLSTLSLHTQTIYTGQVQYAKVGVPNLLVLIQGTKEPMAAYTDANGSFIFRLTPSDTATSLRFLIDEPNYAKLDTLCSLKNDLIFHLEPRAKALGEATVKGQRIFEHNEGNVRSYQPHLKSLTKHAKAEKALRQVPTLIYKNGSFSILGKEGGVTFFINGKEANDLQLKLIDAKDILRIEVQDYDYKNDLPNGSVNIVTKKKTERMLYTEIDGSTSFVKRHHYFSPKFAYYSGNLLLSYIGSYHHNLQTPLFESQRTFDNDSIDLYHRSNRIIAWQHSSNFNASLFLRKSALYFDYLLFGLYAPGTKRIDYGGSSEQTTTHENFLKHDVTLVFHYDFNRRHRFFLKSWGNLYTEKYAEARYPNDTHSRTQSLSLQANLETDSLRIGKTRHNLSYGYKAIFRESLLRGTPTQPYHIVHQLFLVDEFRLLPKLTGAWSLRADYAQIGTQAFKKHFFDLLPQLSFKYVNKKWGNWNIGYEAAVYRPSAGYLNPSIKRKDDLSSVQGNPHLLPERSQKFTFGYSKTIAKTHLSFSVSHTFGKEQIRSIYEAAGNYNVYTYANIGSENTTRLNLALYHTFFRGRLTANGGVTLTRTHYFLPTRAGLLSLSNRGWGTSAFLNLNYLTTKEWNYELSMDFYDRRISATRTTRTYLPSFGLSVEKEVGKHWAFRMSLSDYTPTLHQTYFFKGLQQHQKTTFNDFNLSVGIRYRLGTPFQGGGVDTSGGTADLKTAK